MKRETTQKINLLIDNLLPPFIRENFFFYRFLLSRFTKKNLDEQLNFRDNAWKMSDQELQDFYKNQSFTLERPTDCNQKTIDKIIRTIDENKYSNILEFGCGRGFLAQKIHDLFDLDYSGIDFDITQTRKCLTDDINLYKGTDLSVLPEQSKYDCIISTHTLEHVVDLRRIFKQILLKASKHIILVVPLQLNLKYTPDLHTRFWRRSGDFFLDIGIKPYMNPQWSIYSGDLFVLIEV